MIEVYYLENKDLNQLIGVLRWHLNDGFKIHGSVQCYEKNAQYFYGVLVIKDKSIQETI